MFREYSVYKIKDEIYIVGTFACDRARNGQWEIDFGATEPYVRQVPMGALGYHHAIRIVASTANLEGVYKIDREDFKINLDNSTEEYITNTKPTDKQEARLAFINGFKANTMRYTDSDLDYLFDFAFKMGMTHALEDRIPSDAALAVKWSDWKYKLYTQFIKNRCPKSVIVELQDCTENDPERTGTVYSFENNQEFVRYYKLRKKGEDTIYIDNAKF